MTALLNLVLDLYRLAQDSPATEFQDLALETFKSVVPFRSATWSSAELTPGEPSFTTILNSSFAATRRRCARTSGVTGMSGC